MINKKIDLLIQGIIKFANNSIKHSLPIYTYEPRFKGNNGGTKSCMSEKSTENEWERIKYYNIFMYSEIWMIWFE